MAETEEDMRCYYPSRIWIRLVPLLPETLLDYSQSYDPSTDSKFPAAIRTVSYRKPRPSGGGYLSVDLATGDRAKILENLIADYYVQSSGGVRDLLSE